MTPIIALMVWIAIVGLVAYLLTTFVPMPQPAKTVIWVIAGLAILILFLQSLPMLGIPSPPGG